MIGEWDFTPHLFQAGVYKSYLQAYNALVAGAKTYAGRALLPGEFGRLYNATAQHLGDKWGGVVVSLLVTGRFAIDDRGLAGTSYPQDQGGNITGIPGTVYRKGPDLIMFSAGLFEEWIPDAYLLTTVMEEVLHVLSPETGWEPGPLEIGGRIDPKHLNHCTIRHLAGQIGGWHRFGAGEPGLCR
jgi:hypothetical protein